MEILLNCLWLVLSISLLTAWAAAAHRAQPVVSNHLSRPALLPSWHLQFTAVLVLVLLLFPVISLTDDLALQAATPETEQAVRLNAQCLGTHSHPVPLPSTLAWMQSVTPLLQAVQPRSVEHEVRLLMPREGTRVPVDSRPPPTA